MAFISDRTGVPQVWVQDLRLDGTVRRADHDHALRRSGGVGQLVGRRRLAGLRGGHRRRGPHPGVGGAPDRQRRPPDRRVGRRARRTRSVDPQRSPGHGDHPRPAARPSHPAAIWPIRRPANCTRWPRAICSSVLDMSVDEHLVILRDGQRGKQFCVVVDRVADEDHPLLPFPATGSTEKAHHPAGSAGRRQTADRVRVDRRGPAPPATGRGPAGSEGLARHLRGAGGPGRRRAGRPRRRRRGPVAAAGLERRRVAANWSCSTPSPVSAGP